MARAIIVAAVLAVLAAPAARADTEAPKTVHDFITECRVPAERASVDAFKFFWYCAGVTDGIVGSLIQLKSWGYTKAPCLPAKFTHGEIMRAFQDWAGANPKLLGRPGAHGFLLAMLETWPCNN